MKIVSSFSKSEFSSVLSKLLKEGYTLNKLPDLDPSDTFERYFYISGKVYDWDNDKPEEGAVVTPSAEFLAVFTA